MKKRLLLCGSLVITGVLMSQPTLTSASKPEIAALVLRPDTNKFTIAKLDPSDGSRITLVNKGARFILWSPNRQKVLYSTGYENAIELHVVARDGTSDRKITANHVADIHPSWAPSSKRVVVDRRKVGSPQIDSDLWSVRANGKGARRLTHDGVDDQCPDWSPRGRTIVFSRAKGWDLYSIRRDGSHPRQLTSGPSTDVGPKWSPNGRSILFSRGSKDGPTDLYKLSVSSGSVRRLTRTEAFEFTYGWSPDGRKILYETGSSIKVMRSDGSHKRVLVEDFGPGPGEISTSWSGDSRRVVYVQYTEGTGYTKGELYVARVDGSGSRHLASPGVKEYYPSWFGSMSTCNVNF